MPTRTIADRTIGGDAPTYIIAEIGINHNGDVGTALKLIEAAAFAGCDAVKFQKRTPELCVSKDQWDVQRETPWGTMSYIDYRNRIELGRDDYGQIDLHAKEHGMTWFASCWDQPSVDFIAEFDVPAFKIASASLTDDDLLGHTAATGLPIIASTGMSTMQQIDHAADLLPHEQLLLAHSTSAYPCDPEELNLSMIQTLKARFDVPVGYSGHETGLATTVAAVALGAAFVERHITLDRAMWGSDQAASVEPGGLLKLVKDIRKVELALGDGVKRVYESELGPMMKLRNVR